jgi:drug/metabolite transporter (DMT)-like permease
MKRIPVPALFVTVAFCWGMNSVAMRVASRYGPSLTIATIRAVIGAVVLVFIARRRGSRWPAGREEWAGVTMIGISMTGLSTAFLFLGAKHLPAGLVSIFSNTMPLFTALLAAVVLHERVTGRLIVGLAFGLVGTILVGWQSLHGDIRLIGVLFGLGGAFFAAVGSVLYKRYPLRGIDRLMAVGCQLSVSAVVLGIMSIPDDRSRFDFAPMFWLNLAYLALIGLALAFVVYSELMSRASVTLSGATAYLATVFGVLLGWLLLHERLSWLVLFGGLVTIIGVAIVQFSNSASPSISERRRSDDQSQAPA